MSSRRKPVLQPQSSLFLSVARLWAGSVARLRQVRLASTVVNAGPGIILSIPAKILGTACELRFIAKAKPGIASFKRTAVVDLGPGEVVHFKCRDLVHEAPALVFSSGSQYVLSGAATMVHNSDVRLSLTYFNGQRRVGTDGLRLQQGSFSLRWSPVEGTTRVALALRSSGYSCFALSDLSIEEVSPEIVECRTSGHNIVMIALSEIEHDSRVQRAARALLDQGYNVTLLGVSREKNSSLCLKQIAGMRALIFPNPATFLRDATAPALRRKHTTAYLRACMWPFVERANPRFVHTHNYGALPLGSDYIVRLRSRGHQVSWLHDFHDYVPGYDHMDPEWQQEILEQEARAISLMDYRFTVSPLIAEWLTDQYHLDTPPTLVLNVPKERSVADRPRYSLRHDLGLGPDVPLVVYGGAVREMKGLHTVIEAMAFGDGWHFVMVTNTKGAYLRRLVERSIEIGCRDRLHIVPLVDPDEVSNYLRDASLGIIPFRRYGNADASLPNKFFDYLHAHLPIVTSDCTLMKQLIEERGFGNVFTAEDVADCARAIEDALVNSTGYGDNIASHRELLREWTWEQQSRKLLDAYLTLAPAN